MKVHNPSGSKERLFEMFQRVNKIQINENALSQQQREDLGYQLRDKFESMQDQNSPILQKYIDQNKVGGVPDQVQNHLNFDISDFETAIEKDQFSDEVLANQDVIGAMEEIQDRRNERSLEENRLHETFDVPVVDDKKYLDKTGDKAAEEQQPNKYDGGYDYPAMDSLKTDHESLDKIAEEDHLDELSLSGLKSAGGYVADRIGDRISKGADYVKNKYNQKVDRAKEIGSNIQKKYHAGVGNEDLAKIQKYAQNFGEKFGEYLAKYNARAVKAGQPQISAEDMLKIIGGSIKANIDSASYSDKNFQPKSGVDLSRFKMKEEDDFENVEDLASDEVDPNEFDARQIMKGMEVEMEHTDDPREALQIAMDHLMEMPDYYDELEDMKDEAGEDDQTDHSADTLLDPSQHWVDDYTPKKLGDDISMDENDGRAEVERRRQEFQKIMQKHPDFMAGANYPYNDNIDVPITELDSGNKYLWGRSLPSVDNPDSSTRMVYPPNIEQWKNEFIEKFGTEGRIQAVNGQYDVVGNPKFDQWRNKGIQGKADYYAKNPNEPLDENDALTLKFKYDNKGNYIPQGREDANIGIRQVEQPMGSGNVKFLVVELDMEGHVEEVIDTKDTFEEASSVVSEVIN